MDAATFDAILADARGGISVRKAIAAHKANQASFYRYVDSTPEAANQYAHAKLAGLEAMADEILEIADLVTEPNDRRVRIDTRKWLLSKMAPKKYGDKLDVEHTGTINVTLSQSDGDVL